ELSPVDIARTTQGGPFEVEHICAQSSGSNDVGNRVTVADRPNEHGGEHRHDAHQCGRRWSGWRSYGSGFERIERDIGDDTLQELVDDGRVLQSVGKKESIRRDGDENVAAHLVIIERHDTVCGRKVDARNRTGHDIGDHDIGAKLVSYEHSYRGGCEVRIGNHCKICGISTIESRNISADIVSENETGKSTARHVRDGDIGDVNYGQIAENAVLEVLVQNIGDDI